MTATRPRSYLTIDAIRRADADGYLKIVAAVLSRALIDAQAGDEEAREWLREESLRWLRMICPAYIEPEELRERLLEHAGRRG